jgi:hypothetical protein
MQYIIVPHFLWFVNHIFSETGFFNLSFGCVLRAKALRCFYPFFYAFGFLTCAFYRSMVIFPSKYASVVLLFASRTRSKALFGRIGANSSAEEMTGDCPTPSLRAFIVKQ